MEAEEPAGGGKAGALLLITNKTYLLMFALKLTIVMIAGSLDISVGGVTGLVAMVIAVMLRDSEGSTLWTIPVALGLGIAFGVVQGLPVAYLTPAVLAALLFLLVLILVHKKTKFGRSLYAIGGSPQSVLCRCSASLMRPGRGLSLPPCCSPL